MAEINITYDTIKKSVKATQDGKKVDFTNFMLVKKYDVDNEYNMEMHWSEMNDKHDIYESYHMTCEKYDGQEILKKAQETFSKK